MGSGASKKKTEDEGLEGWGSTPQEMDEDEFEPVKNVSGEIVTWKQRSESGKARRQEMKKLLLVWKICHLL